MRRVAALAILGCALGCGGRSALPATTKPAPGGSVEPKDKEPTLKGPEKTILNDWPTLCGWWQKEVADVEKQRANGVAHAKAQAASKKKVEAALQGKLVTWAVKLNRVNSGKTPETGVLFFENFSAPAAEAYEHLALIYLRSIEVPATDQVAKLRPGDVVRVQGTTNLIEGTSVSGEALRFVLVNPVLLPAEKN